MDHWPPNLKKSGVPWLLRRGLISFGRHRLKHRLITRVGTLSKEYVFSSIEEACQELFALLGTGEKVNTPVWPKSPRRWRSAGGPRGEIMLKQMPLGLSPGCRWNCRSKCRGTSQHQVCVQRIFFPSFQRSVAANILHQRPKRNARQFRLRHFYRG